LDGRDLADGRAEYESSSSFFAWAVLHARRPPLLSPLLGRNLPKVPGQLKVITGNSKAGAPRTSSGLA